MFFGQGQLVGKNHRQSGAHRSQQERIHETYNGLNLMLNLSRAHGVKQQGRNDITFQGDGKNDQQGQANPNLRMDQDGENSQQHSLKGHRLNDRPNSAYSQSNKVERENEHKQWVENLSHRAISKKPRMNTDETRIEEENADFVRVYSVFIRG